MAFTKLENNKTIKFYIKSTDTKPTSLDIPADKLAQLFEVDTGSTYYWLDDGWVQSYSGGAIPTSDFSTATLTITESYSIGMEASVFGTDPATNEEGIYVMYNDTGLQSGETFTIPLYKGKNIISFWASGAILTEGAITSITGSENRYLITGDCSVAEGR